MRRVLIKREIEFIRIFIRVLDHLPLLPLLLKVVLLLVVEMRHELVLQGLVCRYPHARPEDKQLLDQVQGLGISRSNGRRSPLSSFRFSNMVLATGEWISFRSISSGLPVTSIILLI